MTIHLPEDLEQFIRDQVQSGLFASEDEAIAEAVRRAKQSEAASPAPQPIPPWKRVIENMKEISDAVFDRVPVDSSEQLDHYLHGSPKRSNS